MPPPGQAQKATLDTDVYEHHRARGLPEDEAARRAEATVLGSSEVIRLLGRLHVTSRACWVLELQPPHGPASETTLHAFGLS